MSNSKRSTGRNPLGYMGVEATTPAQLIQNIIPPRSAFDRFNIGTTWVNTATDQIWILTNLDGGEATWTEVGLGIGLTVHTDAGDAVETAYAISIVGSGVLSTSGAGDTVTLGMTADADGQIIIGSTAGIPDWGHLTSAGGTITVTEGANTLNVEINTALLGARFFQTDVGIATVAGSTIDVLGGTNINTAGAGAVVTVNLDAAINVTSVTATDVITDNLQVTTLGTGFIESDGAGNVSNSEGTDGQLIIGATAAAATWANVTSTGGTIAITEGANTLNLESRYDGVPPYILIKTGVGTFGAGMSGAVGHSSNVFIGVSNAVIATSADGVTWAARTLAPVIPANNLQDVAVGSGGTNVVVETQDRVYVSTDPVGTWTENNLTGGGIPTCRSISFGNTYWLICGVGVGPIDAVIYTTTPTVATWTTSAALAGPVNDAVYGDSKWVVVGDAGYITTNPTDPTGAWTTRTSNATQNLNAVAYSDTLGLFCAVGDLGQAVTSPDGITWTRVDPKVRTSVNIVNILWDDVKLMFIAIPATNAVPFTYSFNGSAWENFTWQDVNGAACSATVNGIFWAAKDQANATVSI